MRFLLGVSCVVLALFGAACSETKPRVEMVAGRRFEPVQLTVGVGERVTFVNNAPDSHTVTADEDSLPSGARFFSSGGFHSEQEARDNVAGALIDEGESYEVTFDRPGTYRYFCIPHGASGMRGTIVVEDK